MVRRLVEDGEIGLRDEDAGEGDAASLSAAHRSDRPLDVDHAQVQEDLVDLVVARPSAEPLDVLGEGLLLLHELVVDLALADAMRDGVVGRLRRVPRREALACDLAWAAIRVELRLLREVEDGGIAPAVDAARIHGLEAGEDA